VREIILKNNIVIIVDNEDFENLKNYRWYLDSDGYPQTWIGNKRIKMHHLICPIREGLEVDHRNQNKCDNRRENLRLVTISQNRANRDLQCNNKTGFKGVDIHKGRWRAQIKFNKKKIHIGYFPTKEEAARAYNESATRYFGNYAFLNSV
jgi:hypothetical protein